MHNNRSANERAYEDEINLLELAQAIVKGKWLIILITSIISVFGVFYSLSLPNIYESKALLYSVEQKNAAGSTIGAYSSLAGLAGINLPSQSNETNAIKAIEKANSFSFFKNNLLPNLHLPNLMAVDYWNEESNLLVYDINIYDENTNSWVRDFQHPQKQIPSAQESFEVFKKHLRLSENEDTGFVSISIRHQSPFVAKTWTELVVKELNNYFRTKDKKEAEIAADFLKKQIAQTSFTEIKQVVAELLQGRTQQLTLIEVSNFYVFDNIDPPVVMEKKSEPKRFRICLFAALLGFTMGIIIVTINYFLTSKRL